MAEVILVRRMLRLECVQGSEEFGKALVLEKLSLLGEILGLRLLGARLSQAVGLWRLLSEGHLLLEGFGLLLG